MMAKGYITDWALGSTQKWFFLPLSTSNTMSTIWDYFMATESAYASFPSPLLIGSTGMGYPGQMFTARIGDPLDSSALVTTRLQYTPEVIA
jgi:hypothetical protein